MACSEDATGPVEDTKNEDNTLSFSLIQESAVPLSRSAYSDGSMVNRLYYAIYRLSNNGAEEEYELDKYYHLDGEPYREIDYSQTNRDGVTIKILPDPSADSDTKYKMLCWAHYAKPVTEGGSTVYRSDFYDISGFPEVKVNYGDNQTLFDNNDESRDAFYASKEFSVAQKGKVIEVVLTRPLAQINVGTSGWDYEGLASIEPDPTIVKYSRIKVKGVAKSMNILDNKASYDASNLIDVAYDYAVIPAYRNLSPDHVKATTGTRITGVYSRDHANVEADPSNGTVENKGIFTKAGVYEDFLKIDLPEPSPPQGMQEKVFDRDGDSFADYIGWTRYDRFCSSSENHEQLIYNIFTETFKYLSMCYVLVPFNTSTDDNGVETRTGSTVDIEFDCATDKGIAGIYGENKPVLDLKNVPANSNHRTNIIAADGTGFFMNSNEMQVAIYPESFADYYKRLAATDKDWNSSDENGENGTDMNDDYEWTGDIDSEAGKMPLILPGLVASANKLVDVDNKYIDVIKYFDTSVTFTIDPLAGFGRYEGVEDYFPNTDALKYTFFIGDNEVIPTKSGDNYNITVTVSELDRIAQAKSIQKVSRNLEEYETDYEQLSNLRKVGVPPLSYYPIEFRVKTDFGEANEKFVSEDFVGTIRLFTSYKFTFSNDSNDEGLEIIKAINEQGTLGVNDPNRDAKEMLYDEVNSKFIWEGKSVSATHIEVKSRDYDRSKSSNKPGNNDKVFALTDHIRFRGAANDKGHWVILKQLREPCNLTVKIGRDEGVDNGSAVSSGKRNNFNRGLHVNWGQTAMGFSTNADEFFDWEAYDPTQDPDKNYVNPQPDKIKDSDKTTYVNNESKIMGPVKITLSAGSPKDVNIGVDGSTHSYYWIILSEPE